METRKRSWRAVLLGMSLMSVACDDDGAGKSHCDREELGCLDESGAEDESSD